MFNILVEYFFLVVAKKSGSKRVGYWAGARPLYWAAPLLVYCLVFLWQSLVLA